MFTSKALGVSPFFMGLGMKPLQIGLFGQVGNEKIVGSKSVDSYGYGVYTFVPLIKSRDGKNRAMTLSLEAQGAMVAGLKVQNGTSIAFVGATTQPAACQRLYSVWPAQILSDPGVGDHRRLQPPQCD